MKHVILTTGEVAEIQAILKIAHAMGVVDEDSKGIFYDTTGVVAQVEFGEAQRVLNTLRGIQFAELPNSLYKDYQFLGRLEFAASALEGSIYESQIEFPNLPDASLN